MPPPQVAPPPIPPRDLRGWGHFLSDAAVRGMIALALRLPYKARLKFFGGFMRRVVGPLAGYRKRALENLALVFPDMPPDARLKIANACLDNAGRSFIENYSARDFPARMANATPHGPGLQALEEARASGRAAILVTGHFGNYEATRAALVARGFDIGGLYRDMANPYFNAHYVRTMQAFGGPVFAQGRRGTAGFVRHLKDGGQLVLLFDQHVFEAPALDFLGHKANTALSAAELALRYDALLVPFYGIRQPDGISFECVLEAPIRHSDALSMTQAINDGLSARIRENPEQWFWVHRRWRAQS